MSWEKFFNGNIQKEYDYELIREAARKDFQRELGDQYVDQEYMNEVVKEYARSNTRDHIEALKKARKATKELYKQIGIGILTIVFLYVAYGLLQPYL